MRAALLLLVLLAPVGGSEVMRAQDLPPSTPSAADFRAILREGNALHDHGDYEGAIARYRKALALDPGNPEALYEMAYSLYAEKKTDQALEAARRGLERPSPIGAAIEMLIGNIQDDLKQPARAVEAYRAGIAMNPRLRLLHFNLGVTCMGLADYAQARSAFEAELDLFPEHASSHYWLGRAYMKSGYRVPSVLAFARFLILEPRTPRSVQAMAWMDEIFASGVEKTDAQNLKLTIASGPKDEGDFTSVDLVLLMARALEVNPGEAPASDDPPAVARLSAVLGSAGQIGSTEASSGFAARHYVPYYAGLVKQELTDPFCYYALQAAKVEAIGAWLTKNRKTVQRLLTWSAAYRWTEAPSSATASP